MAISSVDNYTNASNVQTHEQLPEALLEVYSLDILHKAQGIMRFEDFAIRKQELNGAPGETIKFTIYDDITRGEKLTEGISLSSKSMSAEHKTITIAEWGNAMKVSEKLLRLSWDDVMAESATLLGRDYAVVRDLALRDAIADDITNQQFAWDGQNAQPTQVSEITSDDVLDVEAIRKAVEVLETNNAPKFYGDYYVCFVHPHQAAYLRRDTDWINAHQYVGTRNIFNGEIGRWEDVIFVTTTHARNGAAGLGTPGYEADFVAANGANPAVYEALMFADQCVYIADSLPVELRDNGVEDFGRTHGLAWYSLFGVKMLQDDYAVSILSA
jgi:N4-gp56 family major capsid protein